MPIRSWLFVPGDSEKKLGKVTMAGADVVIVDLEDSVAEGAKQSARELTARWLLAHRQQVLAGEETERWVRINALDTPHWRSDLALVMSGAPSGIMIPKAAGPDQLQTLAAELYELEQQNGIAPGTTKIVPLVSETAASALTMSDYAQAPQPRLLGLSWGAEDLSAAIGASRKRGEDGEWTDLFRMIRAQMLLVAHARSVAPIDTLFSDFGNSEGLKKVAEASFADGFAGMLAIHPSQVPIINQAFTPSEAQLQRARAIVAAFAANPGVGALQLEGDMIDQPHLEQARQMLDGYE